MNLIIYTLILTHITVICVTLYLHRGQAHKGIIFHPILAHFMRFWLWLTTGMVTKQWVAVHRKHHAFTDTEQDPHSPLILGLKKVFVEGVPLYAKAANDTKLVEQYGVGSPDDWVERNIYSKHSGKGFLIMLAIDLLLFGPWGLLVWGVQMIWIPFWAAGVINGVCHVYGYRNTETTDTSRNIVPIGIIIGGEELHNNHHSDAGNPKLSRRWFEFDIGWMWLSLFRLLGLVKLRT
jgi:stearoyl-CoA desaturase (Delta-9 desaturase)